MKFSFPPLKASDCQRVTSRDPPSMQPAASIRFEIWGVVNPVQEIFDSNRNKFQIFRINFSFPRQKCLTTFLVLNSKNFLFSHKKRRSLANFSYKKDVF